MKLTKIAGIFVVLSGIIVVGGSWYTGKQAETRYLELVEHINQRNAQQAVSGMQIVINDVQFSRGWFSSQVTSRIDAKWEGQTFSLYGNDTLYHGPFPFNRLKALQFMPVMVSAESSFQTSEQLKAVFGEKFATGISHISYSGIIEGQFNVSPVNYTNESLSLEMSPLNIRYQQALNATEMASSAHLANLTLQSHAQNRNIQLKGLNYQYQDNSDQRYPYLGLGNGVLNIENLEINSEDETVRFKGLKVEVNNRLQDDRTLQQGILTLENITASNVNFGKFVFDLEFDLEAKSTNELLLKLSSFQGQQTEEITDLFLNVLTQSPKLNVKRFALENGENSLKSTLSLNFNRFEPTALNDLKAVLQTQKQSHLRLEIDRAYLESIAHQIAQAEKLDAENATIFAKQFADDLFHRFDVIGFAEVSPHQASAELSIDNGKVVLNGREISENELQMALLFFMMGLGGVSQ